MCACARVRVCACASVRVCECARVRVCACASVRASGSVRVFMKAYLSDRLHRAAKTVIDALELLQIPTGHLRYNVIQAGLEARAGGLGDAVLDLWKRDAERELGRDERERIACGL